MIHHIKRHLMTQTAFDDTHVIIHFPPDTIIYSEPTIPPELNKEPRIETLAV
jgi:hypothetical protein